MRRLLSIVLFLSVLPGHSQFIAEVNSLNDAGPGTLREAINNAPNNGLVYINVAGTINLQSSILIDNPVRIGGPSPKHLQISGVSLGGQPAFDVQLNPTDSLIIDAIGFKSCTGSPISISSGNVLITRSVFKDNNATTEGGAITLNGGTLNVRGSSFINNRSATDGGAIWANGQLELVNCTFYGDTCANDGGALYVQAGTTSLIHCTLYENFAGNQGGGIRNEFGSIEVRNCIIFENDDGSLIGPNLSTSLSGSWLSNGGNLIGSNVAALVGIITAQPNDLFSATADPGLRASIVTDGFGIMYFPIVSPTSDALDRGLNNSEPQFDQRRGYRVMQGASAYEADAGAIEYTPFLVTNSLNDPPGPLATSGSLGAAIYGINNTTNRHSIAFDLVSPTPINQGNYLITAETIIDGYTQNGSSVPGPADPATGEEKRVAFVPVRLNNPGSGMIGLDIQGGRKQVVRGLSVTGFSTAGIRFGNGPDSARIEGCHIGLDENGGSASLTSDYGVLVTDSTTKLNIGGFMNYQRNIISNNDSSGVRVKGNHTNEIRITGNFIGTDGEGMAAQPNYHGVYVSDSAKFAVIGDTLFYGNVISGNTKIGVLLSDTTSDAHVIYGNHIGTNLMGTAPIPNETGVVVASNTNLVTIGNGNEKGRNIISGNVDDGIRLSTSANFINGNYIGTNASGTGAIPNGRDGIHFVNSSLNGIGGDIPGQGNLISGNGRHGIFLKNFSLSGIVGNVVGLAADSVGQIPNNGDGIRLDTNAVFVGIGNNNPFGGNIIAANDSSGIHMINSSGGHTLLNNWVGVSPAGITAAGNGVDGIRIEENSFWGTRIGDSTLTTPHNVIGFNGGNGITVIADDGNRFYRNLFLDNGGLAIDLGNDGVTPNDQDDPDMGANRLMNYPVINSVTPCSNGLIITGQVNSEPNRRQRLEFYGTQTTDPSGHGEGEVYLGSHVDTTDASGNFSFTTFVQVNPGNGYFVSGVTTSKPSVQNTSEFGLAVQIVNNTPPPIVSNDTTYCIGETPAPMTGSPMSGGQIVWSLDPTFGSGLDTALTFTPGNGGVVGTTVYYVGELLGQCIVANDSIVIEVLDYEDASFFYPDFCSNTTGSPVINGTPGGTFSFTNGTGGTAGIDPATGTITNGTGGTLYDVQYITPGLCKDTAVVAVETYPSPLIQSVLTTNPTCEDDLNGTAEINASGGTTGYTFTIGATSQPTPSFTGLGTGAYTVEVIDANSCLDTTNFILVAEEPNDLVISGVQTICLGEAAEVSAFGSGSFVWSGPNVADSAMSFTTVAPSESSYYYATLNTGSCSYIDSVLITVDTTDGCRPDFFTAFSPDGDGFNDEWYIPLADLVQNNRVSILNRWGDVVWRKEGYNNSEVIWDGTNMGGDPLAQGTYYFVFDDLGLNTSYAGWVQIVRP